MISAVLFGGATIAIVLGILWYFQDEEDEYDPWDDGDD